MSKSEKSSFSMSWKIPLCCITLSITRREAIKCSVLRIKPDSWTTFEHFSVPFLLFRFFYRISLGSSNTLLRGILHMGMGQSPTNNPHVLYELCFITRRLFPHSNLQHRRVPANSHKPWSSLHSLGLASKAAPSISDHQGLQQDGKQQLPFCQKVSQGWPGSRQDRPGAARSNWPVLSRGMVCGKLGRRSWPLLDKRRRFSV